MNQNPADLGARERRAAQRRGRRGAVVLVCLVAFAHLPLLASDSVIWDGMFIENSIEDGSAHRLPAYLAELGLPQVGVLHWAMSLLPAHVHAYKLVSFACILGAAICLYQLVRLAPVLGDLEALLIAAVTFMYPFCSTWFELIMLHHVVCWFLFLAAARLYAGGLGQSRLGYGRLIAALAMFFLSFTVESLLVFFYAVFVYFHWLSGAGYRWRGIYAFIRRHAVALVLPPIFFGLRHLLLPTSGPYKRYNEIHPSAANFLKGIAVNLKRCVGDQLIDIERFIRSEPKFFLLLAAIALPVSVAAGIAMARCQSRRPAPREFLRIFGYAAFLFVAAIFAYSMANKFPMVNSYNSRHALLAIVPISIGIVMVPRLVRSNGIFLWTLVVVLLLCIAVRWRDYVLWQNRFIKYQAIVENLREHRDDLKPLVVVNDRANFGMPEILRGYEINSLLKRGLGNERHLGIDAREANDGGVLEMMLNWHRDFYMFRDFPMPKPNGPTTFDEDATEIDVHAGPFVSELQIFRDYYLTGGEQRRQFLKSLVRLDFVPAHVHCELPAPGG